MNNTLSNELIKKINHLATEINRTIKLMEVCGTHTVSLRRAGIHSVLNKNIRLISGPGCPVCVTPSNYIDNAIELIEKENVIIATFGDMLKVPATDGRSLMDFSGKGHVKIVYSPTELISIAEKTDKKVVFLGVGFETTIPAVISPYDTVIKNKINNLYLYTAFKTVPNALRALLGAEDNPIDGFILPGHVSVIIGENAYQFLNGMISSVITGFEPEDMLVGIYKMIKQIKIGEKKVENAYHRVVTFDGNKKAQDLIKKFLVPEDALWRGFGEIPESGLQLDNEYEAIDAKKVFNMKDLINTEPPGCLCADVVQGRQLPSDCKFFGGKCTPESPIGPCMVSSEGSCAAYFKYQGIDEL